MTTTQTTPCSWNALGLSQALLKLIQASGYATPTPVQSETIPLALGGSDVLASAQTGTGKTLAFVAPLIEKIAGRKGTFALILCPTREIAQQTHQVLKIFGEPLGVHAAVLIGGINMRLDTDAIAKHPQVLVATPGRLCDHLEQGNLWLEYLEFVVLDEADRMLDMGFSVQLDRIMQEVSKTAQKLLFSATISGAVDQVARRFMKAPVRVLIGKPEAMAVVSVNQRFIYVREDDKFYKLQEVLLRVPGSTIVFSRSKIAAERICTMLERTRKFKVTTIHSDMLQKFREQALVDFKSGKCRILIATDVAGRGIHVDNVAHVINLELPMDPEDYIHRIGRTGRVNATGLATTFISDRDRKVVKYFERVVGHAIKVEGLPRKMNSQRR